MIGHFTVLDQVIAGIVLLIVFLVVPLLMVFRMGDESLYRFFVELWPL